MWIKAGTKLGTEGTKAISESYGTKAGKGDRRGRQEGEVRGEREGGLEDITK